MKHFRVAALCAGTLLLSSCVVVDEGPVTPREPQFCPRILAPVCAARAGEQRSFPNDCEAERNGFRVIADGQCGLTPPPQPGPQSCPRIYDPVCAKGPQELRTFTNDCEADAIGYRILYAGECRGDLPPRRVPESGGSVICPQNYQPVCGQQGSALRTFPNACQAQGSGFRVIDNGPC